MPYIPAEPLYILLLYLRSILDTFVICSFGLQILGQSPDLKKIFRWSLFFGLLFLLIRYIPVGWTSQITLLFIVLIVALHRSRLAGIFISIAAVMLGFYTMINLEWLLIMIRMVLGFGVPVHVTRDFWTGFIYSVPPLLFYLLLVLLLSYFGRKGKAFHFFQHLGNIFNRIEKKDYGKVIPVAQLFTVLLINHTMWAAGLGANRLLTSLIPFALSIIIIFGAYYRERQDMSSRGKLYWIVSFSDIIALSPMIHLSLLATGGMNSPYKLLFIPLIITNIMKQEKVFGYLTMAISFFSLISLATFHNVEGLAWDLEKDLVYMGTFLFAGLCVRYYLSERNKLQSELEFQANTDGLTGLFNHAYALKFIEKAAETGNKVLYIIMIDLDNFKTVNDSLGHAAGDEFLRKVARAIRSSVRKDDVVARYGGDEFIVIIQKQAGDSDGEVLAVAERIKQSVEQMAAGFQDENEMDPGLPSVTASIGVSRSSCNLAQKNSLLKLADEALYNAKRQGKNCVEFVDLDTAGA